MPRFIENKKIILIGAFTIFILATVVFVVHSGSTRLFNKETAFPPSNKTPSIPSGWIMVPKNERLSMSPFLVMKYEAKCVNESSPTIGLTTPNTGYNTYDNMQKNCIAKNSRKVASTSSGYPITNVSQSMASQYCSTIIIGNRRAHLITNKEWASIASDVAREKENWSEGEVGKGYLFAGHNDNAPAHALPAVSNDGNRCAYTNDGGNDVAPFPCPSYTNRGQSSRSGNQVRTLRLSNNSVIWDLSGNLWQWIDGSLLGVEQPNDGSSGFQWRDFPQITDWGRIDRAEINPPESLWDNTYGVGQLYIQHSTTDQRRYGLLRGGNWNSGSYAGTFTLTADIPPNVGYVSLGFRCSVNID